MRYTTLAAGAEPVLTPGTEVVTAVGHRRHAGRRTTHRHDLTPHRNTTVSREGTGTVDPTAADVASVEAVDMCTARANSVLRMGNIVDSVE